MTHTLLRSFHSLRCPVLPALLRKAKRASYFHSLLFCKTGNVLFSQAVARQVSSALESLTSVFEMGTGGSSPPLSPDFLARLFFAILCQLFFPHSLHTPVCSSFVSRASSSVRKNPSQFLLLFSFEIRTMKNLPLSLTSSITFSWLSFRSISIGQLHTLLHFHLRPI